MLRTVNRTNGRNRKGMDPSVPRTTTPAVITATASPAADTIELTFSTRVLKSKLPGFTAGAGGAETVIAATQVSGTVVSLQFSGSVTGTDMNVPADDAGIRTPTGGFVPAGVYPLP